MLLPSTNLPHLHIEKPYTISFAQGHKDGSCRITGLRAPRSPPLTRACGVSTRCAHRLSLSIVTSFHIRSTHIHSHGTTITDHPPPAGSPAYIMRAPTTGHTNTAAHDASHGPCHRLRGAVVHCSARLGEPMSEPRPPAPLLRAAPPRSREPPPLPNRGQPR
ncbi:unnamed protein product [Pleuronectes platessa]|uniref:Uncharacterized protein n=1 Tax=Pleuronectes platessa TaxID=8262 RepID=A0A9N7YVT1_PLEPL|nr:unnamed protein product [Pleuronectes platessa]